MHGCGAVEHGGACFHLRGVQFRRRLLLPIRVLRTVSELCILRRLACIRREGSFVSEARRLGGHYVLWRRKCRWTGYCAGGVESRHWVLETGSCEASRGGAVGKTDGAGYGFACLLVSLLCVGGGSVVCLLKRCAKALSGGSFAVCLVNRSADEAPQRHI